MKTKLLTLLFFSFLSWEGKSQIMDDYVTFSGGAIIINVLANDNFSVYTYPCDSNSITVKDYPIFYGTNSSQNGGVLTFNANNTITYSPPSSGINYDKFYYAIGPSGSVCDTTAVYVTFDSTSPCSNPCAGKNLSFTSVVSGNNVTFNATHTGYLGNEVKWYEGSTFFGQGSSISNTFSTGTYVVHAEATRLEYNSANNSWDTCRNHFCDTIVIGCNATNPCAGNSVSFTSSLSGNAVTLTANVTGTVSPGTAIWTEGSTVLGYGSTVTTNLSPGHHLICVEVIDTVWDSVNSVYIGCISMACNSIYVTCGQPQQPSVCDSTSAVNFTHTVNGNLLTLNGSYSGFNGGTPDSYVYEIWESGRYRFRRNLNDTITLADGIYSVCFRAGTRFYDSSRGTYYDSCYATFCDSITINNASSSPCDSVSISKNFVDNGNGTITATYTFSGYSNLYNPWGRIRPINSPYLNDFSLSSDTTIIVTYNYGDVLEVLALGYLTGGDTCGFNFYDTLGVSQSTGIQQNNITLDEFTIYPNPSENSINVGLLTDKNINSQLIIRDMLGKIIEIREVNFEPNSKNTTTFDVSDLSTGTYYISVNNKTTNQLIKTKPFVKK